MTSADPLQFLFDLERFGMKFGLENIARLCEELGHPERDFQSIVVAGTNGKGSVTVMVETALRAAGHRTGRYTSPHLTRLEERFVLMGREIAPGELRDGVARVQSAVESLLRRSILDAPPTFFECTTATAFELFRRGGIEIAVLEVGLGGRLDATNVVTPIATAITSIDFDHQAQLGDTIESIAREKAGIVKPGVPLVCGPVPAEAERVIAATCVERGAPLIRALEAARLVPQPDGADLQVRTARRTLDGVRLSLHGRHQHDNAAVAVAVLDALGIPVPDAAVRAGLADAIWPARLERFQWGGADVLLDAAHNPAGARALAAYLGEIGWTDVTLVFGAMRDKDVRRILEPLLPFCAHIICTTAPNPRALGAAEIAGLLPRPANRSVASEAVDDPAAALAHAARLGRPVVAAGSIFLIGPLRDILR